MKTQKTKYFIFATVIALAVITGLIISSSDNPIYDDTSDIPLTGGISSELVFDPYSFTFMGYPIHEDHYEEWKSNLGYTPYEDSIAGSGNGYGLEMVFSAAEDMKAFYLIDHYFEETNTYEHVYWSYLGGGYTFIIRPTSSYSHVIDSYFSGPIVPGTTLSELLNLIGYKGGTPTDDEYIKLDNGFTVMLTHDAADLFYNEYYDAFLSLQRGDIVFTFGLNGDAVARMDLNFY